MTTFSTIYNGYTGNQSQWIICNDKNLPQCIAKDEGRAQLKGQWGFLHSLGVGRHAYFAVRSAIDRVASQAIAGEISSVNPDLTRKLTSEDLSGISVMTSAEYLEIMPVLKRIKEIDTQKKELVKLLEERFCKNWKMKVILVVFHIFYATMNYVKSYLSQKSPTPLPCNLELFSRTFENYKTVQNSTWLRVGSQGEISCVPKEEEQKKLRGWSKWLHFWGLGSMGYLTLHLAVNRSASKIFAQAFRELPEGTMSKLSNTITAVEAMKNTEVQAAFSKFFSAEMQRRAILQVLDDRFLKNSPISKFFLPRLQSWSWMILLVERFFDRSELITQDPRMIQAFTAFTKPQLERAIMRDYQKPFALWSKDKLKILYSISTETPGFYYQTMTIEEGGMKRGEVSFYVQDKKLIISSYTNDENTAAKQAFDGFPLLAMMGGIGEALKQFQQSIPTQTPSSAPIAKPLIAFLLNKLKDAGKFAEIDITKFPDILGQNPSQLHRGKMQSENQDVLQRFITESQSQGFLQGLIPINTVLEVLKEL
ncbi:MAG: hypothetical protein JSR58_08200 [Verrucomicrobia bacterium]|nr:hypothetical protein [Verrucomicrobiota bacterium]